MADDKAKITAGQHRAMAALLRDHGLTGDKAVHAYLDTWLAEQGLDPIESRADLPARVAAAIIRDLEDKAVLHAPGGLTRALVTIQKNLPMVGKTQTARVPTRQGGEYCLAPDTRVLTTDMTHVPVGKLAVGDRLAAFDEQGPHRSWRTAVVEATAERRLPCYRVTLTDGTTVVASEGHLWLVSGRGGGEHRWLRTDALRSPNAVTIRCPEGHRWPSRIVRATRTWEHDETWEGGYVAGAFDGEGSLTLSPRNRHLMLSQRPNPLLSMVEGHLISHGFDVQRTTTTGGTNSDVHQIRIGGGAAEVMRCLGTYLPCRLRMDVDRLGQMRAIDTPEVVSVEPLGKRTVTAIRTSTRTLVAEGLATHNSYTYASLADVTDAAMPLLVAHDIAWVCVPRQAAGGGYELAGTLLHVSGEKLEGALPLHGNDPQVIGGAMTYFRRYLLGSMLGIVTDDDPDARATRGGAPATQAYDGHSTMELLAQIDADAQAVGQSYEEATAPLRAHLGGDRVLTVDDLDARDPWELASFATHLHTRAEAVRADEARAAAYVGATTEELLGQLQHYREQHAPDVTWEAFSEKYRTARGEALGERGPIPVEALATQPAWSVAEWEASVAKWVRDNAPVAPPAG